MTWFFKIKTANPKEGRDFGTNNILLIYKETNHLKGR